MANGTDIKGTVTASADEILTSMLASSMSAQRVHEMGKTGVFDDRVSGILPVDERFAEAALNTMKPVMADVVAQLAVYREAVFALVQRTNGQTTIMVVEKPGPGADIKYKRDKWGLEIRTSEAKPNENA